MGFSCYSVHTFTRIRQHYFSKYLGGRMHGPSHTSNLLGDRPPSPPMSPPLPTGQIRPAKLLENVLLWSLKINFLKNKLIISIIVSVTYLSSLVLALLKCVCFTSAAKYVCLAVYQSNMFFLLGQWRIRTSPVTMLFFDSWSYKVFTFKTCVPRHREMSLVFTC